MDNLNHCVECGNFTHVNKIPSDAGWVCSSCMDGAFDCERCGKDIEFDQDTTVKGPQDKYEIKVCSSCIKPNDTEI